jgi:hypothetical protein
VGGFLLNFAAEAVQVSVAYISELEPVATAGLGICLAYLALDRFRYRDKVQEFAILKRNSSKMPQSGYEFESVLDLDWLCGGEGRKGYVPRGLWANFYHHIFRKKIDELLISALAALCAIALCLGVALKVKILSDEFVLNTEHYAQVFYFACVFAVIFPPLSVIFGRKCVTWGEVFANITIKNIAISLAADAMQAQPVVTN